MVKKLMMVAAIILLPGCANFSNGRAKVEFGFGAFIGQYLPKLTLEFEVKQENRLVDDLKNGG